MEKGHSARIRFCVEHDSGKTISTTKIFLNRDDAKGDKTRKQNGC